MNGDKLFIDTNILLYVLNGDKVIKEQINNSRYFISFITELELLSFHDISIAQEKKIVSLVEECIVVDYDSEIREIAIRLRKKYKLKLPDALIAASALKFDLPLVTADKNLGKISEINIYLYQP